MYLLIVKYGDDAERKRIEYVVDKFEKNIKIRKPSGTILILEGEDEEISKLLEELYARITREKVEIYKMEEADLEVSSKVRNIQVKTKMKPSEVWGALSLIMARLRGSLTSDLGNHKTYVVRRRGGVSHVKVYVYPTQESYTIIRIDVEGFGAGFDRLVSSLVEELGMLGEVRSE